MYIREIKAREILDSCGNPTVETKTTLSDETEGIASVPSGASTGVYEALELRDKDYARFGGKGVLRAVENVNIGIFPHFYKKDPTDQIEIDKLLNAIDGTSNKSHLGANAILSVSLSIAKAVAKAKKIQLYDYLNQVYQQVNRVMFKKEAEEGLEPPATKKIALPIPIFNLINGGLHADNDLTIQEFLASPHGIETCPEQLRAGVEAWYSLKKILEEYGYTTALGDEGGFAPFLSEVNFAPNVGPDERVLELIIEAFKRCGHQFKTHYVLGVDAAASTFFNENKQYVIPEEKRQLTTGEMVKYLTDLIQKYSLAMVEDGLADDDWVGWRQLTEKFGQKLMIVGDDLFTTNIARLKKGVEENVANAIIIKPIQIGTLVESLQTIIYAQQNGYKVVVSHRSGETNDSFIADLAVGVGAEFIKAGSPHGERVAKYNRLLEIATLMK